MRLLTTYCVAGNHLMRLWLLIFMCLVGSRQALSTEDPNVNRLNEILSYTNESVAPCDDYYKYACGNWAKKHEGDKFFEITGMIDDRVNRDLITLMEELQQRSLDPSSVEAKTLSYYRTCRLAPKQSLRAFLKLVPPNDQIKWPQFTQGTWLSQKFHWLETLARLRLYGMNDALISAHVLPHPMNNSKYYLNIEKSSYVNEKETLGGVLKIILLLQTAGVRSSKAKRLAHEIRFLENAVNGIEEDEDEEENVQDLTLQELEHLTGLGNNWRKYLEIYLGRIVPADLVVRVINANYLVNLMELLKNWDRDVIASYIMLHFGRHLTSLTKQNQEPITCIKEVRRNMEHATEMLYEQRFIGGQNLRLHVDTVQQLFDKLRQKFLQMLDENFFQVPAAQLNMLKIKAQHMHLNFGNLPQHLNHTQFLKEFYADLPQADEGNYTSSWLQLQQFRMRQLNKQLDGPLTNATNLFYISSHDATSSSTPYYIGRYNTIFVPYGILQPPLLQYGVHDIFKVGLLGFVISHELMHGFVFYNLIFDFKGNFNQLLSEIGEKSNYNSVESCLMRDETDYVEERAADFGAIRLAYEMYFDANCRFNQSQPNFTNIPLKQLFFLNVAQFFCGNALALFENHDPDEIRLRQLAMHFDSFAHSHNCLEGRDAMHPAAKCRIW